MRIGLFVHDTTVRGRIPFLADYLASHEAQQRGIITVPLKSLEDLSSSPVDCVQLVGADRSTAHIAMELSRRKIPFVVYANTGGVSSMQLVRLLKFGGNIFGNILSDHLKNIPFASTVYSLSVRVMVPSQQQASCIEHGFGIPKENIAVVYPVIDERFFQTDASSLKQELGVEHCIFSIADDFHPATNALQLFRSLGKINLPSIVLGKYSGTKYAEACRQIANENPHIRVIDDEEEKDKFLFSALAACEVFVDPSASGLWTPLTVNAAVLGKKVVVSKRSGLGEYFGGGVEFVEPTSWELIHHGIVTVLNNTTNASLRSFLKEECSISRVLDGLHSCYRSAIVS